ncbi:DUF2243 domain-containing protein [Paenibacillus hamazuiensis]|uniref:DUF2243 domain-containing protein n=1 Tax=Paenibacillus hamazuiensis TaxID=2936508 RepID=UPI00200C1D0A|nr:DUF2243 domain-containing protein [Paenibacillus hamazuiensis]
MYRLLGIIAGGIFCYQLNHIQEALAFGLKAETAWQRISAVFFGIAVLGLFMIVIRKWFNRSFYNGFIVAAGLFLSFDIVTFHWIFQLHRITSGPEANVLEPLFVLGGLIFVVWGVRSERSGKKQAGLGGTSFGERERSPLNMK